MRENVPGYLFVLSTLALAVILYLGYASFVLLKAVCLLCLTTYAAVIGLFLVSGAATSFPMTTLPRRASRDVRVFVAQPAGASSSPSCSSPAPRRRWRCFRAKSRLRRARRPARRPRRRRRRRIRRSEFERWYASQPRVPLVVPAEGAKVLVVKFNDFQCPACGQSYLQYKPIFAKYEAEHPGAVKLVLKDYPLNRDCNDAIGQTIHSGGVRCGGGGAARAGAQQDRGDGRVALHAPAGDDAAVGAPGGARHRADHRLRREVPVHARAWSRATSRSAASSAIKSTPTFFINGVKVEGALPPQYFDQAIAYRAAARQLEMTCAPLPHTS